MANSEMYYRRIVFRIDDDMTYCAILIEARGDSPIGVQGWHGKAFPPSFTVEAILHLITESVMWPHARIEDLTPDGKP